MQRIEAIVYRTMSKTAIKLKSHGFDLCTHLILNLPDSTMTDVLNTAKLMNTVKTDVVKLHSLYIAKDSLYEKTVFWKVRFMLEA